MELHNPLKHSLSKLFRSCKRSDVSDNVYPRQHYQLIELFSPKPHHPDIPVNSFDTWHEFETHRPEYSKGNERKSSKKGRKRVTGKGKPTTWPKSISNNNYYDWSTSEDDVDTDNNDNNTLFSSTDSSDSFHQLPRPYHNRQSKLTKSEARDISTENDGFAVVKRSSDPHSDFRSSMVEMIVENQIFGAMELEWLLDAFLSLNSNCHHRVIIEVFIEIWEALFSN